MRFSTAVKTCLVTKYADFQGRASRSEYWWFMLFIFGVQATCFGLFRYCAMTVLGTQQWMIGAARCLETFAVLLLWLPAWGVHIRRLRDAGRSSMWFWAFVGLPLVQGMSKLVTYAILGWPPDTNFLSPLYYGLLLLWEVARNLSVDTLFFGSNLGKMAFYLYDGAAFFWRHEPYTSLFWTFVGSEAVSLPVVVGLMLALTRPGAADGNPDKSNGRVHTSDIRKAAPMDLGRALKTCLLHKYATFKGRASRAEYWWFALVQFMVCILWFDIYSDIRMMASALPYHWNWLSTILLITWPFVLVLLLFVPALSVQVRRLHDSGVGGEWIAGAVILALVYGGMLLSTLANPWTLRRNLTGLLVLAGVNFVYALLVLFWLLRRGNLGTNRYGPDPLTGETGGERENLLDEESTDKTLG